ncbi:MAG: hypothetical protein V7607_5429 [Solirubrobacteraceae bacterium]
MPGLVWLWGGFLLESCLFASVPPLLPHYVAAFALTAPTAAALTGAYPVGLVAGALASHRLARTVNTRTVVIVGLVLIAVSTAGVGLATSATGLVAARACQGAACGCIWAGGLGWLTAATDPMHRGRVLGSAYSAGALGTIAGPALAALAIATDMRAVFLGAGAACLTVALLVLARTRPAGGHPRARLLAPYRAPSLRRPVVLLALQAVPLGLITVVAPLHLARLGASSGAVVGVLFVAAGVAAMVSPIAGTVHDRHGPLAAMRAGFVMAAPCLAALAVISSLTAGALLTIAFVGVIFRLGFVPVVAMLTHEADRAGVAHAAAPAILLTIAAGESVGAATGGAVAVGWSDTGALLVVAGLYLAGAAGLRPSKETLSRPQPGAGTART